MESKETQSLLKEKSIDIEKCVIMPDDNTYFIKINKTIGNDNNIYDIVAYNFTDDGKWISKPLFGSSFKNCIYKQLKSYYKLLKEKGFYFDSKNKILIQDKYVEFCNDNYNLYSIIKNNNGLCKLQINFNENITYSFQCEHLINKHIIEKCNSDYINYLNEGLYNDGLWI